jgi:DNA-binding NtrC family response regulator
MSAPPEKSPRKLLIVDEEENVCNALRRSLRREGYEIDVAHNASEALQILQRTRYDLVLSDHLMPNMTGLEMLKMVRNRFPDCMRLMLTGHADMQTAIDAINHGEIYRFLTKPWDDTELKVTLHLAFEQLDLERENRRLLAAVRYHEELLQKLERDHPGIASIVRDDSGAIVIEDDQDDEPLMAATAAAI